ncbi:hypothetical protein O181_097161 [Austropuccinia psidii MF-1]|uniref:Uncharacterized protein n=1 Tax=Austropuccinia psidii MF-1 TaxID=1389203 RepID=A0A9Q3J8U9_9BASI|nr:hypothetical protein [Austropuccinia psidii MF-1]
MVKRISQIANSPPYPDAEVVMSWMPPAKRFQSQVIPSTRRNFQPTLAKIPTAIPPASPHSSHTRPALNTAVRPSPIQQSRNSPIDNSHQLQPVASNSRREEPSPLPFPAPVVFHTIFFTRFKLIVPHNSSKSSLQAYLHSNFTPKGQFYIKELDVTHKTMAQAPNGSVCV